MFEFIVDSVRSCPKNNPKRKILHSVALISILKTCKNNSFVFYNYILPIAKVHMLCYLWVYLQTPRAAKVELISPHLIWLKVTVGSG